MWKADGVSVDNLTVCNFLAGDSRRGQRDLVERRRRLGKIGMHGYSGQLPHRDVDLLRRPRHTAAQYGIFSSNSAGPAKWTTTYASNFNDSGMYVGACLQVCNVTIDHAWMEYNALGYSGTNSGGAIVIQNSEFDHNQDGLDTNTQIAGDPPRAAERRLPGQRHQPDHAHALVLGVPAQQRARQQQPERARRGQRERRARSAPA